MGLVIKIKNIVSPNSFKLFYQEGRTPGSSSEQLSLDWGTQIGGIYSGGTSEILVDLNNQQPYGKQYWFKILDIVTNSFIIENIYVHERELYDFICATPTPTPTITLTPTLTITPTFNAICTFTGGSAFVGATPTPTPTITQTITPTLSVVCTFTGGSAVVEIQPTPTPTVTPQIVFTLLGPISGLSGTSSGACSIYNSGRPYYSNVNFMQSNVTYIYENNSLSTPLNTGGQWKGISFNGVNIYAVITNSSGMVTNYTSC